eukprot:scaffold1133_cov294-Chaetoceros_neogracile.AAC.2
MNFAFALLAAATSVLLMSVVTAFRPIILVDIYIETQPLADLKSKDDARTGDPILVRVAKFLTTADTHSQHMVTTMRHNQTVVVIPIWAGNGKAEVRRRRPSDHRLGCVRVSVPPAPRGVARIFVSTYVMFEYCGYWKASGMPPHIHRDRLLVKTWVEGDEKTSNFSDAVLYAQSPAINCFPMGRWHPSDLKDQMSSISEDGDHELMYNSSAVDILLELTDAQDSRHNRAENEVNRVVELAEHMCETSTSNNNAGSYVCQCKSTISSNSSGCTYGRSDLRP